MSKYAAGRRAFGFCDKTGFRYPLKDLVEEYVQGEPTGFLVGRDVADEDHPQNFVGLYGDYVDPQALRDPRPDPDLVASRSLFSWNPAGVGALEARSGYGQVSVEVS